MIIDLPRPTWWQKLNHRLASSRIGAWVFSRTFHHLDRLVLSLSGGRATLGGLLTGLPLITLTTTGAKSGLTRSVPLVGIPDGETIVLIASNWGQTQHPAWYFNLSAHPQAAITRAGKTGQYLAHEATSQDYEIYWNKAVSLYAGYAAYLKTAGDRHIPIMVLTPAP
jgi:deazaflavin-dependent oxidoreductase (nitroreductase family)